MEFYSYFHGYYIRRNKRVDDRFESKIEIKKKKEGEEKEKRGKFVKFAVEGLTRTEEGTEDKSNNDWVRKRNRNWRSGDRVEGERTRVGIRRGTGWKGSERGPLGERAPRTPHLP